MQFYSKEADIKGKNVIMTGGTKNLGGKTAEELARCGANLFLHYHSTGDKANAESFAQELTKSGVKVGLFAGGLDNASDVTKFYSEANKFFGGSGIDIAVNNIGMVLKKPMAEISEEEFESMNVKNNKIAFFFIQEAGKNLNEKGKIVSIVTSLLAAYTPFYSTYQGTKAPVEYYSKSASKELQAKGISVNCVAPGPMDTPFFYPQEAKGDVEFYKTVTIRNRLTEVEDVVPIVRFLVTEGYWITGQTLYCSGGFTAH